ncbi:alpha/beta fold hydrolase [Falsiroseomonas sp. HW251]|uniref:alpha/beta fold hydrolase n=1 Tax=Falsiroseomonas sp. HW251 TaxID=3390998 RepID=UPI003D3236A1
MTDALFAGFELHRATLPNGLAVNFVTGGAGPPLLLLHGWPQTHAAWHRLAPRLAADFTVIAPDLRGYGGSDGPEPDGAHRAYAKRAMAEDALALMDLLGHERFGVLAHDRGARVGYRLALDAPARVAAFVSLTVIPTVEMWRRVDRRMATGAWHWFLFQQPGELPERMLAADPDFILDWILDRMAGGAGRLDPRAFEAYRNAFRRPEVRRAMVADYRAAATTDEADDLADEAAGRRLRCPMLVLWEAARWRDGETPADIWRRWSEAPVAGAPIAAGHLMAETAPDLVLAEVQPFLREHLR